MEYVSPTGRRLGAPAGSALEDRLIRDGWIPGGSDVLTASQEEPNATVDVGDDLAGLRRAYLDELALDEGIVDPGKLPNKQAVIDAIREARGGDDEDGKGDGLEDLDYDALVLHAASVDVDVDDLDDDTSEAIIAAIRAKREEDEHDG